MKIISSRIKLWDFNERLKQIDDRIEKILNYNTEEILPSYVWENLEEIDQIVKYWKKNMKSQKKKEKRIRGNSVNIYD